MAFRWLSKTKKWQTKAKPTWHHFVGKINWFGAPPKKGLKRRACDLKNQDASQDPTQAPTGGFNLLQISSNWFLGNWTLDPGPLGSKVGLRVRIRFQGPGPNEIEQSYWRRVLNWTHGLQMGAQDQKVAKLTWHHFGGENQFVKRELVI